MRRCVLSFSIRGIRGKYWGDHNLAELPVAIETCPTKALLDGIYADAFSIDVTISLSDAVGSVNNAALNCIDIGEARLVVVTLVIK